MDNCIFCAIINGEIPSQIVYKDEFVTAFRDINPQAPVHIVIVPNEHISSVAELTSENSGFAAKCLEAAAVIAQQEGLVNGFRIISNCGSDAGQTVQHLHFHLIGGKVLNTTMA